MQVFIDFVFYVYEIISDGAIKCMYQFFVILCSCTFSFCFSPTNKPVINGFLYILLYLCISSRLICVFQNTFLERNCQLEGNECIFKILISTTKLSSKSVNDTPINNIGGGLFSTLLPGFPQNKT